MTPIKRIGGSTNAVVVQLPERSKPGVVIQQDTIGNLGDLLQDLAARLAAKDYTEATELVQECSEIVAGFVSAFTAPTSTPPSSEPEPKP